MLALVPLSLAASCSVFAPPKDANLGPAKGSYEFALGGAGLGNSRFNGADVAFSGSVGYYLDDDWLLVGRQDGSYSDEGNDRSAGSTRIGVDWFVPTGTPFRPFVGVNGGFTFGESINETIAVGPEFGLRYFVKPSTFVQAMIEAQVFFTRTEDRTELFDDGALLYSFTMGATF